VTSNETAATHDLQTVQTAIAVTFHVDPAEASYFWQNFRSFDTVGQRIITPSVSNDVKAITARYDAQELVTSRDRIDAEIKDLVVASLAPYHLTVETANGAAQATILQAEAEAKANALVNASLTPAILQLRALSRWNGVMPTYLTGNTPLPFIGATPGR
jgi:regulator of protease activity HflC (stomatin/prohibitin superfamily)